MNVLLAIHSLIRWLIVITGLVLIAKHLIGWRRQSLFTGTDRGLSAAFTGMMDLQFLLGLAILLISGFGGAGFPTYRIEHSFYMVLAVLTAHLPARWQSATDAERFRNSGLAGVVAMVLIAIGVSRLPGGWSL